MDELVAKRENIPQTPSLVKIQPCNSCDTLYNQEYHLIHESKP